MSPQIDIVGTEENILTMPDGVDMTIGLSETAETVLSLSKADLKLAQGGNFVFRMGENQIKTPQGIPTWIHLGDK